ncbi:hypothetical protein [Streptomyces sp. NPDC057702]|uniref:hypothetical protein n=1 Tax=unclassified Streptomyces TaxID=2593676 RepID=UPI0036C06D4B
MPRPDDDYEPVFKKSKWGTNRYVYNADNPVGLALIILSCVVVVVFLYLITARKGPFALPESTPPPTYTPSTFTWDPPPVAPPTTTTPPTPDN